MREGSKPVAIGLVVIVRVVIALVAIASAAGLHKGNQTSAGKREEAQGSCKPAPQVTSYPFYFEEMRRRIPTQVEE